MTMKTQELIDAVAQGGDPAEVIESVAIEAVVRSITGNLGATATYIFEGLTINEATLILESINDKSIFKAVILAGGPGAGKSYIAKGLFGGTGVRLINSDEFFEFLLGREKMPLKIADRDKQPELYAAQMAQRARAKELTKGKASLAINGMLPLVIDGTGKDYANIREKKRKLEAIGYDVGLVFVNTTLDVALARNERRERTVAPDIVRNSWQKVQANLGKFQSLFGKDMEIIDNSVALDGSALSAFKNGLTKMSMKILNKPVQNRIGVAIMDDLRASGGKYLDDLGVERDAGTR